MIIGALDVATTTGRAILKGDVFRASSFRPRTQRPTGLGKGELSYRHEGAIFREFRDELGAWIKAEEIEHLAFEQPLRSDVTYRKRIINKNADWAGQAITYEEKGGTTMNVIFRLYNLIGVVCELCDRYNVKLYDVNQSKWRKAFFGDLRPPKGVNASQWWKAQAKRQCELLKIHVPNADAAESVGVCWWLRGALNPVMARSTNDLFA